MKSIVRLDRETKSIIITLDKAEFSITETYRLMIAIFSLIYDFHKAFPNDEVEADIKNSCFDPSKPNYVDKAREYHTKF